MKFCFILGTRPEIIKLSPLIRWCQDQDTDHFIIHSGQHYSYEMDAVFYEQLGIAAPKYNLGIKSRSAFYQGEHTGRMLIEIEDILLQEKPDMVVVQGDTNTVLSAAICVNKLRTSPINMPIRLAHVEAGLRSFDRTMTEEINRVLADHLSDYLFAPSPLARDHLLKEAVEPARIFVVGNTIVDAVKHALGVRQQSGASIVSRLNLLRNGYFLMTAHRQENVDNPERLRGVMEGARLVTSEFGLPVIFPVHPRTKKQLETHGIGIPDDVKAIDPVGFFESLELQAEARVILTDSGGLQEEASVLGVPCVTMRDNTERHETVAVGHNLVVGTDPSRILAAVKEMFDHELMPVKVYGDGRSAEAIMNILFEQKIR